MNNGNRSGRLARLLYRVMLGTRYLGGKPSCAAFAAHEGHDAIERIYVINLDRHDHRLYQMRRELGSLRDRSGNPLTEITRRFSAVDARYYVGPPSTEQLRPYYSLADQLFVEPNPLLDGTAAAKAERIEMTRQEVAVALSHIAVWRRIAASDGPYILVLEDDACFRHGFARRFERAWADLMQRRERAAAFDLLYLSYKEALTGATRTPVSDLLFRPVRGLWQLSGYVLSARGAQRLLDALPVHGPVDLWINYQFERLEVYATQRPLIEQRPDCPSANAYSVLPVLSKVGVLTREKPLLPKARALPGPVIALGDQDSGLTALATALSMLGYRCCSDIDDLPAREKERLFGNKRDRVFRAYVGVGSLGRGACLELAKVYRGARFVITVGSEAPTVPEEIGAKKGQGSKPHSLEEDDGTTTKHLIDALRSVSAHVLLLPAHHSDKWELLCGFLGCDYPGDQYPDCEDLGQRTLSVGSSCGRCRIPSAATTVRGDQSPWIVPSRDWFGISLTEGCGSHSPGPDRGASPARLEELDPALWMLRDDTFPSNLAIFSPANFSIGTDGVARLVLLPERTSVRDFTSASICSRQDYLYGHFVTELKPASTPGLVTGMFLHRNSPRQEIDIEFLGKDTTKMLVNVYYNPGSDGARMEYGYRGTPALVDLGFDAARDFHRYEIEWSATAIIWRVDGQLVHERVNWDPTPIPHLPMQLNVNLWYSRSEELAGKLALGALPAQTELRAIEVHARPTRDSFPELLDAVSD